MVSPVQAADLNALPVVARPPVVAEPGPFDLNLTYSGELWHNSGGLKTGTDQMSALDANLTVDAQKLFGWQNGKFYLEGFYVAGRSLENNYTGAIQAPSAVDAYDATRKPKLYQAYYEQTFGKTDILVGKYDVQTQFATTRPMDVFGNKAQAMPVSLYLAGIAVGLSGISAYPNTAVGVRIKQSLSDEFSIKVGLLDGQPDRPNGATAFEFQNNYGAMGIGEIDYTPSAHTKLMAGIWGETGKLNKLGQFDNSFAPITKRGEVGEYVGAATRVVTLAKNRGIDVFANVGFAPQDTNLVGFSFDAGVTATGLFSARPTDKLGVAVAVEENSSGYRSLVNLAGINLGKYETAFELTYRARLNEWLVLQPEAQYIINPSAGAAFGQAPGTTLKNAFVFGLHLELNKEFN